MQRERQDFPVYVGNDQISTWENHGHLKIFIYCTGNEIS